MIHRIDFENARALLDAQPDSMLLDVRTEEEYEWEHACGAVLLPLDAIDEETAAEAIPTLATHTVVYCRSGSRSAMACKRLVRLGYENVYDLGGLNGWPYGTTPGLEP